MELIQKAIDVFLHLDTHLQDVVGQYGALTYLLLFAIVFCETGLVVTPFLPGDSLLFAAGAIAAGGALDVSALVMLLIVAAILGDTVNYHAGVFVGPKVFERDYRFLKREHLVRTQQFYEKHGGKTIIIARFVPIIRTFAPFVAGVGTMSYRRFLTYNVVGGVTWVVLFVLAGYWFGNRPFVKKNFTLVVLAIIVISVLPAVFEYIRQRRELLRERAKAADEA